MALNTLLLGPPEIYKKPITATDDGGDASHQSPQFGFTENNSLTYVATRNPCLDFFFHVVPDTPSDQVIERLCLAYSHNPLTAVKLICNLRGVRGTGKSDKEGFYTASLWLHKNHPKTPACNVKAIAAFGYYKDLLEILFRILEGNDVRQKMRTEWSSKKGKKQTGRKRRRTKKKTAKETGRERDRERRRTLRLPREIRIKQNHAMVKVEKEYASELRKDKKLARAKKAFERYNRDAIYRFLHDSVADFFKEKLKMDIQYLNVGEFNKISLTAKWCPTIDSMYDKCLLICESIAKRIFPRDSNPEYHNIEEPHYAYRVRDRLRKQVLVPLHEVLELPEVYMSANNWEKLPYSRVSSVAMKNYKEHFLKHDKERFEGYLEKVKRRQAKIAAGALLPHEIIASLGDGDGGEIAELQWKRMVEDLINKGKLNNCIAVCDVSESMNGTPMEVCVALGLMISEISEDPWKGKVITFSRSPEIHMVEGDSLWEKTQFVREMDWDNNTNFQKVFDKILQVAVDGNLTEDQMIKRIFVFSDMEFDQAHNHSYNKSFDSSTESSNSDSDSYSESSDSDSDSSSESSDSDSEAKHRIRKRQRSMKKVKQSKGQRKSKKIKQSKRPKGWETDYEVIHRKFREKGYNRVPEIVFWNLRDSSSTPVASNQKGVALVSGFSKNMVKLFLDNDEIATPEVVMEQAISGELYQKLAVYD